MTERRDGDVANLLEARFPHLSPGRQPPELVARRRRRPARAARRARPTAATDPLVAAAPRRDHRRARVHAGARRRPAAAARSAASRPDEGIAGWVATHDESLLIADVATDPRFSARMDTLSGFRTRSVVAVPLRGPRPVHRRPRDRERPRTSASSTRATSRSSRAMPTSPPSRSTTPAPTRRSSSSRTTIR